MGLRGRRTEARIDGDDLRTRLLGIEQTLRPNDSAFKNVVAKENQGRSKRPLGDGVVRRAPRANATARIPTISLTTVKAPVSTCVGMKKIRDKPKTMRRARLGRLAEEERVISVLLLRLLNLLGNSLNCLIPRDRDKFAFPTSSNSLEGRLNTICSINMLDLIDAPQADSLVLRIHCIIGLDKRQTPITNRAFQAAAAQAVELMAQIRHALLGLGVCLGRRKPIARRGHARSARDAQSTGGCTCGFEKTSTSQPCTRAIVTRHVSLLDHIAMFARRGFENPASANARFEARRGNILLSVMRNWPKSP